MDFLYLSRAEVQALLPAPREMEAVVEAAFRGLADGSAEVVPKNGLDPMPGTFFHAMPARPDGSVAGMKWVGVSNNAARGRAELPHINALIVLNDLASAGIQAVMDGDAITALRPAVVSLLAARRLARTGSARIGFVACGTQARSHFEAFAAEFPLREARCYGRRRETAQGFANDLAARGVDARAVAEPREAVEGMDIVVTSIPRSPGLKPCLDPAWLSPGSFVSAPDLARGWICGDLRRLDILATDDLRQSAEAMASGHIPWSGTFDCDLTALLTGKHPGRSGADQKTFFIHPGLGLGDIAIASLVLERALAAGAGTRLPR
ncbi:MAG: ornithine cyclodeaminase family protein [Burkholderiales bacterium]|nr:ornithine cyclodeaminase family protein [Burkholderiales bacterium]